MGLVISGLLKSFGPVRALDGISFTVEPGEVFGFLGANGAGKTTAMRIVLDILRADGGTVTWKGRSSTELPRGTFGYLPEERGLYPRMKVLDQLVFFAGLYGVPRQKAAQDVRAWLTRFRVPEYADRRAEQLSKGNQQKVQFIAAILHDPEVLIMDEPFTGLDPVNVALLKSAFLEMRDRGKTLIFSTHQMDMVEELCDSIAIIDAGRLVASGPTRDVKRSTGKQVVRLATDGDADLPWLAEIPGVTVVRPGRDFTEMEVLGATDPEAILHAAIARGDRVTRFEIADPSIEQIFVERVGRSARDDVSLAGLPDLPIAPGSCPTRPRCGRAGAENGTDAAEPPGERDRPQHPRGGPPRVQRPSRDSLVHLRHRLPGRRRGGARPRPDRHRLVRRGRRWPGDDRRRDRGQPTPRRGPGGPAEHGPQRQRHGRHERIRRRGRRRRGRRPDRRGGRRARGGAHHRTGHRRRPRVRHRVGGRAGHAHTGAPAAGGAGAGRVRPARPARRRPGRPGDPLRHRRRGRRDTDRAEPGEPSTPSEFASIALVGQALVIFLLLAIVLYGQWIATSAAEEKSSRVMEIVISAATPFQLLGGKVLGVGGLGLVQLAAAVLPALAAFALQGVVAETVLDAPATSLDLSQALTPGVIGVFILFFVLGLPLVRRPSMRRRDRWCRGWRT